MKSKVILGITIFILTMTLGFFIYIKILPKPLSNPTQVQDHAESPLLQLPPTDAPEPLNASDFVLAKIRLQMTRDEVLRTLGAPLDKIVDEDPSLHNPDYTCYYETWSYPQLKIIFLTSAANDDPMPETGLVFAIEATSPKYATPRGIKVGDPKDKLFKEYGKPIVSEGFYSYEDDMSTLSFTIEDGMINCITVYLLLD